MPRKQKVRPTESLAPIPAEILDQFVRQGPLTPEELDATVRRFKKAIIERALSAELSHHLGYLPGGVKPGNQRDQRAIGVRGWHAENYCRSYFRGHAEIDQPHFATGGHVTVRLRVCRVRGRRERHEISADWEIVVGLGRPAQQLGYDFLSLCRWKRLDGLERALGCLRHD